MFAVALTDEVCGEISAEWEKTCKLAVCLCLLSVVALRDSYVIPAF